MRVLVLNPGSTSTKLAWYEGDAERASRTVAHIPEVLAAPLSAQLEARAALVETFLAEVGADRLDAAVALGGLLRPGPGGTYAVGAAMLADLRAARYGRHASALGALMADAIVGRRGGLALVVDPISTDELDPVARISGVPGVERWGRSHALSLKAVAREVAARLGRPLGDTRLVGLHLGGGISVAALRGGRIVDVNDAMLGMGPFSTTRAGALPLHGVLDLAFAPDVQRAELEARLVTQSGLLGYLGTADLQEVEARADAGDTQAADVLAAMGYQIVKEAGAMAAALELDIHAFALTGGMAASERFVSGLQSVLSRLAPVHVFPGEREMSALAQGALRVLRGEETPRVYRSEAA